VDSTALESLAQQRVEESEYLEFHEALYSAESDGQLEFAKDVSALANLHGGAIVLGVRESNGVAVGIAQPPLSTAEVHEQWLRQAAAQRAAPLPAFSVRSVTTVPEPRTGYWLIVVPPSPQAPHSVAKKNEPGLRYPIRHGRDTR